MIRGVLVLLALLEALWVLVNLVAPSTEELGQTHQPAPINRPTGVTRR